MQSKGPLGPSTTNTHPPTKVACNLHNLNVMLSEVHTAQDLEMERLVREHFLIRSFLKSLKDAVLNAAACQMANNPLELEKLQEEVKKDVGECETSSTLFGVDAVQNDNGPNPLQDLDGLKQHFPSCVELYISLSHQNRTEMTSGSVPNALHDVVLSTYRKCLISSKQRQEDSGSGGGTKPPADSPILSSHYLTSLGSAGQLILETLSSINSVEALQRELSPDSFWLLIPLFTEWLEDPESVAKGFTLLHEGLRLFGQDLMFQGAAGATAQQQQSVWIATMSIGHQKSIWRKVQIAILHMLDDSTLLRAVCVSHEIIEETARFVASRFLS